MDRKEYVREIFDLIPRKDYDLNTVFKNLYSINKESDNFVQVELNEFLGLTRTEKLYTYKLITYSIIIVLCNFTVSKKQGYGIFELYFNENKELYKMINQWSHFNGKFFSFIEDLDQAVASYKKFISDRIKVNPEIPIYSFDLVGLAYVEKDYHDYYLHVVFERP